MTTEQQRSCQVEPNQNGHIGTSWKDHWLIGEYDYRNILPPCRDLWSDQIEGFTANRFELQLLAKHWLERTLLNQLSQFEYTCISRSDIRWMESTTDRFAEIVTLIGKKDADEVVRHVEERVRRRVGERQWNRFNCKDEVLREAYRGDEHRRWAEDHKNSSDQVPDYVKEELFHLVATRFPEEPALVLATVLRRAADDLLANRHPAAYCDHEWETAVPWEGSHRTSFNENTQRCAKCHGIRHNIPLTQEQLEEAKLDVEYMQGDDDELSSTSDAE